MPGATPRADPRTVLDAEGRAKAYRPLPAAERTAAVVAGLEAYAAGDYFEAHELMEPAWMGTDDGEERDLIQGLIKLAAAEVHGVRGNPRGVTRNLEGAGDRLRRIPNGDAIAGVRIDPPALLDAIERRLAEIAADSPSDPVPITWSSR